MATNYLEKIEITTKDAIDIIAALQREIDRIIDAEEEEAANPTSESEDLVKWFHKRIAEIQELQSCIERQLHVRLAAGAYI